MDHLTGSQLVQVPRTAGEATVTELWERRGCGRAGGLWVSRSVSVDRQVSIHNDTEEEPKTERQQDQLRVNFTNEHQDGSLKVKLLIK